MVKVSTVKEAVFASKLFSSKTQTSLLITVSLALTPLIIDSMLTDDSFQCPKKRGLMISSLLLFGPTICITLLGLSHSIKYIREHDNRSLAFMIKRIVKRIFTIGITMCVTIGSSFLLSEHYVCLMAARPGNNTLSRNYLVSQSRQMGWLIIMGSLFLIFLVALMQLLFHKLTYLEKALKLYISFQRKESKRLLEEALSRLSQRIVENKLSNTSKNLKALSPENNKNIQDLLLIYRQEQMDIISSKKNFMPRNPSFKEKFHYFSMSLDDTMDHNPALI